MDFDQWFSKQGQDPDQPACYHLWKYLPRGDYSVCIWCNEESQGEPPAGSNFETHTCPGCGKEGLANYDGDNWFGYYCGGSPRCCP